MKSESRWGSKFYESLSKDLRNAFPNSTGLSPRNLQCMRQFYELFPENIITQQLAAQITSIPWGHILLIISKANNSSKKRIVLYQKNNRE